MSEEPFSEQDMKLGLDVVRIVQDRNRSLLFSRRHADIGRRVRALFEKQEKLMSDGLIEPSPTQGRYVVIAVGESDVQVRVRLTPLQRDGVIEVFNAVNGAGTGNYEPQLWLFEGDRIELPVIAQHTPPVPLNRAHYAWRQRIDGKIIEFAYDAHGQLKKTEYL